MQTIYTYRCHGEGLVEVVYMAADTGHLYLRATGFRQRCPSSAGVRLGALQASLLTKGSLIHKLGILSIRSDSACATSCYNFEATQGILHG